MGGSAVVPNETSNAAANGKSHFGGLDDQELKRLRWQFSQKIPDGKFSPADLQEFLIRYKNDPRGACIDISSWTKEILEGKKAGTKMAFS